MEFVKLDNDEERKERKQLMMAKEMTQHCNSLQLRYSAPAPSFMKNKAGYTANTSCGRVGRGGNARFHTFQLDHHDGLTDRPTDGQSLL